jgi:methylmalonyl-CoA/ethylmalonyl-CoA epimerase
MEALSDQNIGCRLDHIGIAVRDVDASLPFYQTVLGCLVTRNEAVPDQGIAFAMLPIANTRIELLAPIGAVSPLAHLLEDRTIQDFMIANPSGGIHHLCYAVSDLEEAISALQRMNGRVLGTGAGIAGVDGTRVVFLDPGLPDNVLVELKQERL